MDFGISQALDQAIYTVLNAVAVILWRLNATCLNISMLAYQTQAWLTGEEGGVWNVLARMTGAHGIFGLSVWEAFFTLALALYGLSRVARPFFPNAQPVQIGKLFMFGVLSYIVITQGSRLMHELEDWRVEAGNAMYEMMAQEGGLAVPGGSVSDEPLNEPRELDGEAPLRGWEAVSTSYFLAGDITELQAAIPPAEFRRTYCLYDPALPLNEQDEQNSEGCSPRIAWDEWDELEVTLPISHVWGIELPGGVSIDYPMVQEHPENRQLGLRQAQAGVARLALGPIVALFPLVEANISLMLVLAASFVYLSLPIVLLFGFFMATEALANQLLLQLIHIFIRTLILNSLVALFLMLLMGTAIHGSLMSYLGLVGVGLAGGILLMRFAAGTMKESMGLAFGAVGRIWTRTATTTMGESARRPAQIAMGAATLAGTAATMMAASRSVGWMNTPDVAETGFEAGKRGLADLRGQPLGSSGLATPASLMALANANGRSSQRVGMISSSPAPANTSAATGPAHSNLPLQWGDPNPVSAPVAAEAHQTASIQPYSAVSETSVQGWADQLYQSHPSGQRPVAETGRMLLGEDLSRAAQAAMSRHSRQETQAVLQATQQAAAKMPPEKFVRRDGQMAADGLRAVRAGLDEKTAHSFSGKQGERDLAALVAAGVQPRKDVKPDDFREAVAQARDGRGERAPGRSVPSSLGLDPVAAGSHFAGLNRFVRLSEQSGLSPRQRQQLLQEVKQGGRVSAGLHQEIERSLRRRERSGVGMKELLKSAHALPQTLRGPQQVHLPGGSVRPAPDVIGSEAPAGDQKRSSKTTAKPDNRPGHQARASDSQQISIGDPQR